MSSVMYSTLIAANVIVVGALLLLLFAEQRRSRLFRERLEHNKRELIALTHRLRTPLSEMRKYHEFLRKKRFGKMNFSQQEAIHRIYVSFASTVASVNALLEGSQLHEGVITMERTKVRMCDAVRAALSAAQEEIEKHRHRVSFEGDERLEAVVDPLLLHGILDEILQNAIRYMPDGGVITIKVSGSRKGSRIEIADRGIGISVADQKHLFQKFFRGEKASRMHSGNGMGLSFAIDFASQIGGAITCKSREGKGSSFTLTVAG